MNCQNEETSDNKGSNRLVSLFNRGLYSEVETLAHAITREYPHQGEAWKLLGKALFIMGKNEDALAAMRMAAELLPNDLDTHTILASILYGFAYFAEAETVFLRIIQIEPELAETYNNLGVVQNSLGKFAAAEISFRHALEIKPNFGEAYNNLGNAIRELERKAEAVEYYRMAIHIKPDYSDAYDNLGTTLMGLGCIAEAESSYRQAIGAQPDYADAYNNLGVVLRMLGRLDEAEVCYKKSVEIEPDFAEAHNNLGITLKELGRLGEAEDSYRRALEIKPEFSDAYNNLGIVLKDLGHLKEAEASYRHALEIKPDVVEISTNLANLLNGQGRHSMALEVIWPILQTKECAEARAAFVNCVKHNNLAYVNDEIRAAIVRALIEPWARPSDLALISSALVMNSPYVCEYITRANSRWPLRLPEHDLCVEDLLVTLANDRLLCALLISSPICNNNMEHFLTIARSAMLASVSQMTVSDAEYLRALAFYSALAQQCFINEYVFFHTEDEIEKATALRERLIVAINTQGQVPISLLVVVACYFPLCSLPGAAKLYENEWPEGVLAILNQQVREPEEELCLRASITRLTEVEDNVSLQVQNQYEENPYPRWVKAQPSGNPVTVSEYLRRRFPLSSFKRIGISDAVNILVAGCGTGQHPIGTAQNFRGAQILAVDLSVSSLCYAKRKTRELGLTSIFYAQADILKLSPFGCNFDVIESCGVLHHQADPFYGWQILLSLLRPGGVMKLGFYSALARRNIVKARDIIAQQGFGTTVDEIRLCRQVLVDSFGNDELQKIYSSNDFFSVSSCRDLLFHVQEHHMTLTAIDTFLRENKLTLLGFEIDDIITHAYKVRFPNDQGATNLSQWHIFESENPDTFCGMYQFWIQKTE